MTGKLFRNFLLVGIWVFLLSVALFMGMLYQYFTDQITRELVTEVQLVAQGVEETGMDYLSAVETDNRITWVDGDGTVLYDSVADAGAMANHADREEIQEALRGAQGAAVRESSTLSERTIYAACRLEDGTVIRLSSAQHTVVALLLTMVQPLLLILVITMVFAAVLASRLSKRIIRPILDLDLEHPEEGLPYDELSPLLTRIRKQNETIRSQMALMDQRRQEFNALTENMSEGFLLLDAKGRVLSYNTGALRLLETAAPDEEANVLTLDRSDAFRRVVDKMLSGQRCQGRLEREDRTIQLLADPVQRGQETAGGVLVLLDVTEREQGERLRREFTANVSHELKTPLTAISGMAEIMKNGIVKPEDVTGFADDIYRESQRLIRLVEDIIHLSRLDEGAEGLERQPTDLLEVAQRVRDRLSPLAKAGEVTLSVEGEHCTIGGVPAILEEMIYNLCDNAIKYNHPGGSATITVARDPAGARLTVSDTGIGIPEGDQERVFERFYRVDKSHSKEIGGTGLGLSIVKHGAALHDARVELESAPGKGTRIQIQFPRQ